MAKPNLELTVKLLDVTEVKALLCDAKLEIERLKDLERKNNRTIQTLHLDHDAMRRKIREQKDTLEERAATIRKMTGAMLDELRSGNPPDPEIALQAKISDERIMQIAMLNAVSGTRIETPEGTQQRAGTVFLVGFARAILRETLVQ